MTTGVTGTLPVANGGTGQTSYTNGQLLIGNTTGNTLTKATLTQGTGITITNSAGAITIAASGGGGSGDVVGPASSTDNALVRFDTTTGKLIQNSTGILSDAGALSGLTTIDATGAATAARLIATTANPSHAPSRALLAFNSVTASLWSYGPDASTLGDISLETRSSNGSLGGRLAVVNQYGIGLGAADPASGMGITFPATQSASSNANTLDDYEEGTWTPTDNSGAGLSFTGVSATYTKVGRIVTCLCELNYPVTASSASANIAGLPFTSANVQANRSGGVMTISTTATVQRIYPAINNTTFPLLSGTGAAVTNANCSGVQFNFCITYFV